jgi:hypothetical protein
MSSEQLAKAMAVASTASCQPRPDAELLRLGRERRRVLGQVLHDAFQAAADAAQPQFKAAS